MARLSHGELVQMEQAGRNAERCVCCGEIIPEGRQVCPNCVKLKEEFPTEMEVVLWRPFPLIKPKITHKEYLVTLEGGGVDILWWDGFDWVTEKENYFIKTDSVIAWTTPLSPYKPREEKTDV